MRLLTLLSPILLVASAVAEQDKPLHLSGGAAPQSYVNTAVARTVELGGGTTLVTTQYNVKALTDEPGPYVLALAGEGSTAPAWFEVLVGGKPVEVVREALGDAPAAIVPVGSLKKDDSVTISLNALLAHSSHPRPREIEQRDPQYLVWETNSTLVDSAYPSDVERIKIRSPTPKILSYGKVPTTYTRDSEVTKSTSTLTLGPFYGVPPTVGKDASAVQTEFFVHYETTSPVVGVRTLRRAAEVSHWGDNLNIQDEVVLFNDGPKLKGQFSRLAHQQSRFHASTPAQVLSEVTLRVPPSAHSVYYYDVIGNVSTSHFRMGKKVDGQRRARVVDGVLELKPRYPLLGGWNYSFTVGWDSPLTEALRVDPEGTQVLAVPFLTPMKDVVVDDTQLTVVLPEGATDVEVFTPFPVDSIEYGVHKTYLDTIGRPTITITKSLVTENHAVPIYVTYRYSLAAQLQKPATVAAVVLSCLVAFTLLRRVDYSIDKQKKLN